MIKIELNHTWLPRLDYGLSHLYVRKTSRRLDRKRTGIARRMLLAKETKNFWQLAGEWSHLRMRRSIKWQKSVRTFRVLTNPGLNKVLLPKPQGRAGRQPKLVERGDGKTYLRPSV